MLHPDTSINTGYMKHFMSFIYGVGASLKQDKILYLFIAFLLAISVVFFIVGLSYPASSLANRINAFSYSLGFHVGKNMQSNGIHINMAMFLRGLDDGRHGRPSPLTNSQVNQANEIVMLIMQCDAIAGSERIHFNGGFMNDSAEYNEYINQVFLNKL